MCTNHLCGKLFKVIADFVFCELEIWNLSDRGDYTVMKTNHLFKKGDLLTMLNESPTDFFDNEFETYYNVYWKEKIVRLNISYLNFCELICK